MNKFKPYITAILITTFQSSAVAQSYPNYAAYQASIDTANTGSTKTPPANFFPNGKSTSNFFENKSVTPNMASTERKVTYGTDIFHQPSGQQAVPAPEDSTSQVESSSSNGNQENWASNDNNNSDEVKTLTANIQKASEQSIEDPKIRSVLEQSKKIKEALFGISPTSTNSTKKPLASSNPEKTTKEIERF